jgi:predicted nucleotidyltransferase
MGGAVLWYTCSMSARSDPTLFERLRTELAERSGIRVAVVFGSRARKTEHAGSDLDLGIDGTDVDLSTLAGELSIALGLPVDTVSLDPAAASIPLLEEVMRDGVVVYEHRPGAGAAWRSRALTSLETDRPGYAAMRDAYLKSVATRGLADGQS